MRRAMMDRPLFWSSALCRAFFFFSFFFSPHHLCVMLKFVASCEELALAKNKGSKGVGGQAAVLLPLAANRQQTLSVLLLSGHTPGKPQQRSFGHICSRGLPLSIAAAAIAVCCAGRRWERSSGTAALQVWRWRQGPQRLVCCSCQGRPCRSLHCRLGLPLESCDMAQAGNWVEVGRAHSARASRVKNGRQRGTAAAANRTGQLLLLLLCCTRGADAAGRDSWQPAQQAGQLPRSTACLAAASYVEACQQQDTGWDCGCSNMDSVAAPSPISSAQSSTAQLLC